MGDGIPCSPSIAITEGDIADAVKSSEEQDCQRERDRSGQLPMTHSDIRIVSYRYVGNQ